MIKKIDIYLTDETSRYLKEMCDYTGLSVDAFITAVLWDSILRDLDKKDKKRRNKRNDKNK